MTFLKFNVRLIAQKLIYNADLGSKVPSVIEIIFLYYVIYALKAIIPFGKNEVFYNCFKWQYGDRHDEQEWSMLMNSPVNRNGCID